MHSLVRVIILSLFQVAAFLCPPAKQYLCTIELKKAEAVLIQEYNEILRLEKSMSPLASNTVTTSLDNAEKSMELSAKGHPKKSIEYLPSR